MTSTNVLKNFVERYENLSPSEFEDMVAEWLRCKGYSSVEVTGKSGDMGRDVIGFDPQGIKEYIEVKQHERSIGRPVVQKLHSIMTVHKIEKGKVVTTSTFSSGAAEYAKETGIELVEGHLFLKTCKDIVSNNPVHAPECIYSDPTAIVGMVSAAIPSYLFSFPRTPNSFVEKVSMGISLQPNLLVKFSAYDEFRTSGAYQDLIRRINYVNQWVGMRKGSIYQSMPGDCTIDELRDAWKGVFGNDASNIDAMLASASSGVKSYNVNMIRKDMQRMLTQNVSYYGRNNRRYTRECKPAENKIQILDYTPFWDVIVAANVKVKNDQVGDGDGNFVILNNQMLPPDNQKMIVCDECETPCRVDVTRICRHCGKVMCDACSGKQRFLLFFKRYWCKTCLPMIVSKEYGKKKSDQSKANRASFNSWLHRRPSPNVENKRK